MLWILQEAVVKPWSMVLDSPGSCCETICIFFKWNIYGFGFSRRLLWSHDWWCWILQEAAVKPFANVSNEILMVLDSPGSCCEAMIDGFGFSEKLSWSHLHLFCNDIFMVLVSSRGCCEAMIDGLESRGGCRAAIYKLLHRNINGFGSFRTLLWIHYWWLGISRRLLWRHLHVFYWNINGFGISRRLLWIHY